MRKIKKNEQGSFKAAFGDFNLFSTSKNFRLRKYQEDIASRVVRVVAKNLGLSLVVMLPRQSGKNELQAQLEAYLLLLYARDSAISQLRKSQLR